jgi:hypothetical protein
MEKIRIEKFILNKQQYSIQLFSNGEIKLFINGSHMLGKQRPIIIEKLQEMATEGLDDGNPFDEEIKKALHPENLPEGTTRTLGRILYNKLHSENKNGEAINTDCIDRLDKIANLYKENLLTRDEFEILKKRIINSGDYEK